MQRRHINLIYQAIAIATLTTLGYCNSLWAAPALNLASIPDKTGVPPPPTKMPNQIEPLAGTLFFSREQREKMDRTRSNGGVVLPEEGIAMPAKPSTINGFVKRSDGKNTVWIDGEVQRNISSELSAEIDPMSVGGNEKWLRPSAKNAASISGAKSSPVLNRTHIKTKRNIKKENRTKIRKPPKSHLPLPMR